VKFGLTVDLSPDAPPPSAPRYVRALPLK